MSQAEVKSKGEVKTHVLTCDGLERKYVFLYLDASSDLDLQHDVEVHAVVYRRRLESSTHFKVVPVAGKLNTLWLLDKLSDNGRNKNYSGSGCFDTKTPADIVRQGLHSYLA